MKAKILSILAGAGLLVGAQSASALVFYDVDFPIQYVAQGETVTGSFNILKQGYDPSCMEIYWVGLEFLFRDDHDRFGEHKEKITLTLDSTTVAEGQTLSWFLGFSLVGGIYTSGTILADLSEDGILNYSITAKKGDFYLKEAGLLAKAREVECAQRVPDAGGTLAFLGLGVAALMGAQRRFAAR
ncbi:MAG TPA: VPDSG-CTERM sorting domain-containing protein [Verrucomicrobia bacterium]|nr:VPDSG-CTERM sorting domain-containing protein [Verrucomicrobiota bacterium]HOP98893.1 VPDSG-CTERM sorting domain-containing protein [Verrucomicrobiota bacterium]HPU55802.1 VPDSG-CTERM sorting domain-containing protein [Verrucomicrobiota bacterium]